MNQQQIGSILREYRQEKKLTQKQVADNLVITPQTISKWEKGLSQPSIDMLIALANLYEVSIDELLQQEKKKPDVAVKSEKKVSKARKVMIKLHAYFKSNYYLIIQMVLLVLITIISNEYNVFEIIPVFVIPIDIVHILLVVSVLQLVKEIRYLKFTVTLINIFVSVWLVVLLLWCNMIKEVNLTVMLFTITYLIVILYKPLFKTSFSSGNPRKILNIENGLLLAMVVALGRLFYLTYENYFYALFYIRVHEEKPYYAYPFWFLDSLSFVDIKALTIRMIIFTSAVLLVALLIVLFKLLGKKKTYRFFVSTVVYLPYFVYKLVILIVETFTDVYLGYHSQMYILTEYDLFLGTYVLLIVSLLFIYGSKIMFEPFVYLGKTLKKEI